MAGLTLDAGPLIGFERRDRRVEAWVDAPVVACAAARRDRLLTSDPDDLRPLADAAGVSVLVL